jgi:hypothetical protein
VYNFLRQLTQPGRDHARAALSDGRRIIYERGYPKVLFANLIKTNDNPSSTATTNHDATRSKTVDG